MIVFWDIHIGSAQISAHTYFSKEDNEGPPKERVLISFHLKGHLSDIISEFITKNNAIMRLRLERTI